MKTKLLALCFACCGVFVLSQSFESPISVTLNYPSKQLKWLRSPDSENVTLYNISYITPSNQTNQFGDLPGTNILLSAIVPAPVAGKYAFIVKAKNQFGTSEGSTVWVEYAPFPPSPPQGVTVE